MAVAEGAVEQFPAAGVFRMELGRHRARPHAPSVRSPGGHRGRPYAPALRYPGGHGGCPCEPSLRYPGESRIREEQLPCPRIVIELRADESPERPEPDDGREAFHH